jgi:ABC-2 type transport system ATP-binding protein
VEAVAGIDLEVAEGEIYAFLGPNGAGKTTVVRMLTTLLRPSGGRAVVAGLDVVADPPGYAGPSASPCRRRRSTRS